MYWVGNELPTLSHHPRLSFPSAQPRAVWGGSRGADTAAQPRPFTARWHAIGRRTHASPLLGCVQPPIVLGTTRNAAADAVGVLVPQPSSFALQSRFRCFSTCFVSFTTRQLLHITSLELSVLMLISPLPHTALRHRRAASGSAPRAPPQHRSLSTPQTRRGKSHPRFPSSPQPEFPLPPWRLVRLRSLDCTALHRNTSAAEETQRPSGNGPESPCALLSHWLSPGPEANGGHRFASALFSSRGLLTAAN